MPGTDTSHPPGSPEPAIPEDLATSLSSHNQRPCRQVMARSGGQRTTAWGPLPVNKGLFTPTHSCFCPATLSLKPKVSALCSFTGDPRAAGSTVGPGTTRPLAMLPDFSSFLSGNLDFHVGGGNPLLSNLNFKDGKPFRGPVKSQLTAAKAWGGEKGHTHSSRAPAGLSPPDSQPDHQ